MFEGITDLKQAQPISDFHKNIRIDILDMLLEVSDIDYGTYCTYYTSDIGFHSFEISIEKYDLDFDEIKDCVNRIVEYLYSKNSFNIRINIKDDNDYTIMKIGDDYLKNSTIEDLVNNHLEEDYDVYSIQIKAIQKYDE